ncbi:putative nuclease HARBI1 [Sitodiplosis mosellana]|uniref:putative nuclease HARBI1 n=1 Tax=Sitodiplosis mosellana TaxID=263140 RepID=UPI002443A391|nr:putative nuclease HARBI1 [Sitodiplosis mosellana]
MEIFQNNTTFREAFRVDMDVAEYILMIIGLHIQHETERNHALSPKEQLLTALHWYGNGSQYHTMLYCHDVAGLIDGTHIKIDAPSGVDEAAFVNRHNHHSINLTVVCGPQLQFFYATAQSPGSVHDARALRVSSLWRSWETNHWRPFRNAVILGDSAYPSMNWLLTPTILQQNIRPELAVGIEMYRQNHRKTRFKVENSIGVLREQFPCLNQMRVRSPTNISRIIMACVTLHNIQNNYRHGSYRYDARLERIANRIENGNDDDDDDEDEDNDFGQRNVNQIPNRPNGAQRQREYINYFNNPF